MKTLYLDCGMGAAGDMLAAALLELHPDAAGFVSRLNQLGIPGVTAAAETVVKQGIAGTHLTVRVHGEEEESLDVPHDHDHDHGHTHDDAHDHAHTHDHDHNHGHTHDNAHDHAHTHDHDHAHHHDHDHMGLGAIENVVSRLAVPEPVKQDVMAVYRLIADAESDAHKKPVAEVHFHEVGAMDAIADITAVCWLVHELAPEQILASPVHTGSGHVRCAHGVLPVPAPATAYLLKGIPSYSGDIRGELCTPTGAALLRHFVKRFGSQPVMRVDTIGYGMGKKDFERLNCVRASLGQTEESTDQVVELSCNLDDMTPEAVAFAMDQLFEAGALEVYTQSIGMKKNRPGILLTCMCRSEQRDTMIRQLFRHTTTLGLRENVSDRYVLRRSESIVQTEYGPVRVKQASGWGIERQKAEYEDLARIARSHGLSLDEVSKNMMQSGLKAGKGE